MAKRPEQPCALTVAGSDSGGGAGIQADLKTFAALGVHGTCALTCLTAQNPRSVARAEAVSGPMLLAQLTAVFDELAPCAVKTGMLYSARIIEIVTAFLSQRKAVPLVVDPVMISTSGSRLLQPQAVRSLVRRLLPRCTLTTPNLDETSLLLGRQLTEPEDLRSAARELHERFGCAALVKGGHLKRTQSAIDIYYDGTTELLLEAPWIKGVTNHGTGCTYSAAVTACLAQGNSLPKAVEKAKGYITRAIANSTRVRGHDVLGCFPRE